MSIDYSSYRLEIKINQLSENLSVDTVLSGETPLGKVETRTVARNNCHRQSRYDVSSVQATHCGGHKLTQRAACTAGSCAKCLLGCELHFDQQTTDLGVWRLPPHPSSPPQRNPSATYSLHIPSSACSRSWRPLMHQKQAQKPSQSCLRTPDTPGRLGVGYVDVRCAVR